MKMEILCLGTLGLCAFNWVIPLSRTYCFRGNQQKDKVEAAARADVDVSAVDATPTWTFPPNRKSYLKERIGPVSGCYRAAKGPRSRVKGGLLLGSICDLPSHSVHEATAVRIFSLAEIFSVLGNPPTSR
ncbi:hypothetical protein B0J18DRAFT_215101 [Chaetomium sp. MPI-SDFR-AT-0129]|nr:hypothetical protein B0J18DRAFT_215101 [Chaetomium sp. MPI-SDFR-AT-0129]